jgi:hypothetical protein
LTPHTNDTDEVSAAAAAPAAAVIKAATVATAAASAVAAAASAQDFDGRISTCDRNPALRGNNFHHTQAMRPNDAPKFERKIDVYAYCRQIAQVAASFRCSKSQICAAVHSGNA